MTVIALFETLHIAISDVLLTVDDRTFSTITPTTGNTANFPNLEFGVSGLARKIISADGPAGRAQFLVAGRVTHIKHFAMVLQQIFRNQLSLPDELRELVRNSGAIGCMRAAARLADADGFKEFEVVGVAGDEMCTHTFDATRITDDVPYFGKLWIAGSGAADLLHWLQIRADRYAKEFAHHDIEERRYHVGNAVTLFLMEEDIRARHRTIKTGVGGYYEAYGISHGTLTPIGDCITVFGDIVGRGRDSTLLLKRVLYHCYRDEHLYVFSLLQETIVNAGSSVKIPLSACKLFDIAPLSPDGELSPWSINRVVSEMLGAKHVRTVVGKVVSGHALTKRFLNTLDNQLVKLSLSGENLAVTLDVKGFQYFSSRFPSDISDSLLV